jgi:hypothetical protein
MKNWKVVIEYEGNTLELFVEGKFYSDAYVYAEINYPGCTVVSIKEIHSVD